MNNDRAVAEEGAQAGDKGGVDVKVAVVRVSVNTNSCDPWVESTLCVAVQGKG